jgi:SAM-dependent methyltransferase
MLTCQATAGRRGGLDVQTVLAKEREIMNSFAPHYRTSYFGNSYFYREERKRFMAWVLRTLREAGRDPARLSFLNPGSSVGDLLEPLARAGARRLTGLDIAEEMLRVARRRVPSARFILGSIESHDFGPERFDVILTSFTLHHMLDPRAFFTLVDRVLAPGGWFFILDYNAEGWENAPGTKPVVHALAAPLRRLMKWKNRRILARQPDVKFTCNPAHHLLTYGQIRAAMPSPAAYRMRRHTRGVLLPAFNYALVEESALDRTLARGLDLLDRVAEPFAAGNLQWIAGQRRTNGT